MAGAKSPTDDWALGLFSRKAPKSLQQIISPFPWTPLLFLLMGLGASGENSSSKVVSGLLGGSVTFSLNISGDPEIEHVTWISDQNALAFVRPNGDVIIMAKSYQGRLSVMGSSYSLCISNLALTDAGPYKAQINQKNSNVTINEAFTLHVYEKLQEPQVTLESVEVSENTFCNITLKCSVKGAGKDIHYNWTSRNFHASESYEGSILTISRTPCDPDLPYTCTAWNPVSQSSSQPIRAWKFCADPGASRGRTMGKTMVGTLGEPITLPLALSVSQKGEHVVWIFNSSIIRRQWEEATIADPLIKSTDPDKNRMWVSRQDNSLKISRLMMEDAGHYHAYVCSETSMITSMKHVTLLIYRRLKKPNITWKLGNSEDGICRVSLTCSVEEGENVTYTWTPLQKGAVMSQGGSCLNVSWKSVENHPNFTCTASNPVTNISTEFLSRSVCSGLKRNSKLWIGLPLVLFGLPFCGVFSWFIWKKKQHCAALVFSSSQADVPANTPEPTAGHMLYSKHSHRYEKLDMPLDTARQQPRPTSYSSTESNVTAEEDEERTETNKPTSGRDEIYDMVPQEDIGHDSEGRAEYNLITPSGPVVDGDTVYTQVFLNFQAKTPVPPRKEESATIYCSIQKPSMVTPTPRQNDHESSEIPTYENFT
ncbi:T-lymphocyte surface antigen Ly-9 [Tupaia chinensis]|uniref:T-lymphocyte surface antigen Ly-9 n=1 Tax=Tupaia chinensis TaxID=246437 RepID=UPI0003C905FB|nr:T-lymphocyte surface antigen Ly-9 [Tupaia chinensis]